MSSNHVRVLVSFICASVCVAAVAQSDGLKKEAIASVERQRARLIDLSDRIWTYAELALCETRSSGALAEEAQAAGFKVERGVAEMPTAFVATFGEGRPVIGILGEFDALPGLSQKATATREAAEPGAAGHGCGHNLFGAASLGAAIAIKELVAAGKLRGTIRFYGTPAEESVGGKLYMARAKLFDDLDVCLAWHPDDKTRADTQGSQALVDLIVEFKGTAAHAAYDPWNGRSAVDGMELFMHGLNLMREHVKPSVRMHYAIQKGGDVPNVVPEYAKLWCWVRDSKRAGVDEVLARVRKLVEGAALMAGVEGRLSIQTGDSEMLVNMAGARLLHANLTMLGPLEFSAEEQEFARALQKASAVAAKGLDGSIQPLKDPPPDPPGGSTDVADVSWIVPMIHLNVTTAADGSPWHAWPIVSCSGMSIGHKGLVYAAKALAATAIDLFVDPKARETIRAEFSEQTKGHVYKGFIPDGPPPVPGR